MERPLRHILITVFTLVIFIPEGYALNPQEGMEAEPVRPKLEYKARGLRDPFKQVDLGEKPEEEIAFKPAEVESEFPNLTVQGVIWGGIFPQAVINNQVVKAGDTIDGVIIKEINKEGVTVLFLGTERILSTSPALGSVTGSEQIKEETNEG